MQQANDFIVLNICEYLENDDGRLGETVKRKLARFSEIDKDRPYQKNLNRMSWCSC